MWYLYLVVVEKNKEGEVIKKTIKYQDERFKNVYKKTALGGTYL